MTFNNNIKYRNYNTRKARRKARRKLQYKNWRREENKKNQRLPKKVRMMNHQLKRTEWKFDKVIAPSIFSFCKEPNKFIKFITSLNKNYDRRKPSFIVLKKVEEVDYDALVVLLSTLVNFKVDKIDFNGDFPRNKKALKKIKNSGFYDSLYKEFKSENKYVIKPENNFITNANKMVDSSLGDFLIGDAAKVVWGKKRRCKGAQRTLIEIMQNTKDHATDIPAGKHWWLSVNHNIKEKVVSFSFVDYGVGVFESLKNKPKESKFFGGLDAMFKKYKHGGNNELLKLILNGDLHETVTGKKYRGKGLPGIKEAMDRNYISDLQIITNNVHANIADKRYVSLHNRFKGTFITFKLKESNKNEVWSI